MAKSKCRWECPEQALDMEILKEAAKGNWPFSLIDEVAEALSFYDQRNLIKSFDDIDQALERLVHDWADHAYDRPQHARILAATNDQVHQANELAQQKRIEKGVLNTDKSRTITDHVSSGATYTSKVHLGDRVIFTKNEQRKYGVLNGSVGTITRFKRHGKLQRPGLEVLLDTGKTVYVPLSFESIRLGYASTVHKAQGGTYEEAFVLLSGTSQNLPNSYVKGTRARQATHFYTERALYNQIQELKDCPLVAQMERSVDLSLAADLCVPHTATAETAIGLEIQVIDHWKKTTLKEGQVSLVVTNDPDVAASINERCLKLQRHHAQVEWEKQRQQAQDASLPEALTKTSVHDKTIAVGDRIRFSQGSLGTGIFQNEFATITKLDGGTIDDFEAGRNKLAERARRRDIIAKAVELQRFEISSGPLKGQAVRAVCETLEPEQRAIASKMLVAVGDVLASIKEASEFSSKLRQHGGYVAEPLQDLSTPESVRANLESWLSRNSNFAKGEDNA